MSRGFVKEDDLEHAGTDMPERPISAHINYVTPNGLKQLQQQALALDKARVLLVEQKDDASALQRLGVIDRDLRYLSARLEQAELVEPPIEVKYSVFFGATVKTEDENGDIHTVTIVGEDEADISQHKVSWVSPLAKALIGNKVGDNVVWKRPAGDLNLEIIEIKYSI
jgi:transcription elongation GreA/GreB family factor